MVHMLWLEMVDVRSACSGPCRKTFLQDRNGLWRKGSINKDQILNPTGCCKKNLTRIPNP